MGEEKLSFKTGLCSISFRSLSPEDILKNMKKAGLGVIEWGSDVHAPKDNPERLREIAKLQKEYEVSCSSYGTYFRLGTNPTSELEDYIVAAKTLGTDILRLWCGDKNSEDYSPEQKEALFNCCKAAADVAEKHNVKFCMECHHWTYTNSKESALELMKTINSEHFRMYWQPNQFKVSLENIEYAKLLSSYTEYIHVFNWEKEQKYPLKKAKDTWRKYLDCFSSDKTLLLEFMPDDKIETLQIEANSLKEILK